MTDTVQESPDELPPISAETLPLYLPLWKDGELSQEDEALVESLANENPEASAILALLDSADTQLSSAYSDVLSAPLPIALARSAAEAGAAIDACKAPANTSSKSLTGRILAFSAMAAGVAMIIGLPLAYHSGTTNGREAALADAAAATKEKHGWVAQIAGYHGLYSKESRHLVEVSADEADHIQNWIGTRTGRSFTIPDLAATGLEFRGARLLAVNGEPTAQLMYTPVGGGDPVGLCFLKTGASDADLNAGTRDGFNFVTWRRDGFSFIAIGATTADDLQAIAQTASISL